MHDKKSDSAFEAQHPTQHELEQFWGDDLDKLTSKQQELVVALFTNVNGNCRSIRRVLRPKSS